ncbi:E3 ubiquitin-protein ligase MPSR1-like [Amaranthus tricolor]|uniref:E3 ubiquitin-protein ligase MPSR1-like n=1 Tax=Amaranthus tricolor TaxID=29722 RepID=UPI00258CD89C|nr:E3 ubiquitin-protein ligase MPSR1-like [Amaranthus tricolor]
MASSESSQPTAAEMQSFLERIISSRNRDLSMFIPFLLGFTSTDPSSTRSNSDTNADEPDHNSGNPPNPDEENQRDRIVLINPLTQGMVVIEGTGLDSLFRSVPSKDGPPPASKSAIEAIPSVEIKDGEQGECVICLEECEIGGVVKEMPCKHRFHSGCIEKWLALHGSCPVCRFTMPVEEEDGGKKREEEREGRRGQREIWVSFAFGRGRRRTEEERDNQRDQNQNQNHVESSEFEMGN